MQRGLRVITLHGAIEDKSLQDEENCRINNRPRFSIEGTTYAKYE